MIDVNHLSALQRTIIADWWNRFLVVAITGPEDDRLALGRLGVPWHPTYGDTPSKRASVSRSLRRLHARGVLIRHSSTGRGRTTHVMLTDDGFSFAKRLTSERPAAGG